MKRLALILLSLAIVSGCTSEQPAAEKPKTPDLLTGREGFQKVFIAARGWASDARPYKLESGVVGDYKGHDGKAVIWNGSFASATMRASKPYGWSGIDSPDAPSRGVNPGTQDSYRPGNDFDPQFLKVDSDKAFDVAQKHGGDKVLQSKADTPVIYLLDWNGGENKLIWHVIYGSSRNNAALVIDVDATGGEFIRKEQ